MPRVARVFAFVSLLFGGADFAACVSQDNAPLSGSSDSGTSGFDATIPLDSAPAPDDAAAAADARPSVDAGRSSDDASVDAALSCGSWTPYMEFDASSWDGAALSTASTMGASLPGPAPTVCGGNSASSARLVLLNNSPCALDVWWVDWLCEEDFYGTIPPGESWHVTSISGDVWRLRAAGTEELLEEIPPLPSPEGDASIAPTTTIEYPPDDAGPADAAAFPPSFEQNPDASACTGWDAAVEFDAGAWDGAPSLLADDAGTLPGPPATACSVVGDHPYELMFVDDTSCPIDVYWVDYQCNEEYWQTIEMGRNGIADTFATNVWRLRAHGSGELLVQAPIVPETADAGNMVVRYP